MPELPKKITIDLAQKKLFIDGIPFPWPITDTGPQLVDIDHEEGEQSVTITLLAEAVEVIPATPEKSLAQLEAEHKLQRAHQQLAAAHKAHDAMAIHDAHLEVRRAQADLARASA
ncbi:hypothetical protein [Nocardia asiatica]|uniref:hypothetical protein n=1 Tax=Nocardia asiatica TaxID=209252 RepID=UPI0024554FAE|nr:hypothetical protein [Nocardia asiatica]